jgi:hypothetical protein
MKSILKRTCRATSVILCSLAVYACNGSTESKNGGSCSQLDGTWAGHEVDLSGGDRGPVTFVVQDGQIQGNIADYGYDPESYTVAVSCNERVTPHQISGTITASNQPQAEGLPFYGIYEMNSAAKSGRLSALQPGSSTFPTTFAAGAGQRLFVFGGTDAGATGPVGATAIGSCNAWCDAVASCDAGAIAMTTAECKQVCSQLSAQTAACQASAQAYFECMTVSDACTATCLDQETKVATDCG